MSNARRDDFTELHITYDLWDDRKEKRRPEAKSIRVSGEVRGWRVGRFHADGKDLHAVKVIHGSPKEADFIEVPEEAVNVQLHLGTLPKEFRSVRRPA